MNTVLFGMAVAIAAFFSQPCAASTPSSVSASRLSSLSRGINADNIVNNVRLADYTADDIARLQSMGINNIRIPIDPAYLLVGVPVQYTGLLSDPAMVALGTARLSQYVKTFVQAGFAVTLVIQPQRSLYRLPDSQTEALILQGIAVLTSQYAGIYSPDQLFFEALNEPHYDVATWNAFAPQIVAAIRKNAPNHTIIVPPASWDLAANFSDLTLINDPNIIYTMHVYEPSTLTTQGAINGIKQPSYRFPKPSWGKNPTEWSYAKLNTYMHVGIDWAVVNNVPLIMNEFGCSRLANRTSRNNWIHFVRHTAQQNHVGWAFWSFDGRLYGLRPRGGRWDADLLALLSS